MCCSGKIFGFIIDIFGESNLREYGINGNLRYSAERHTVIMYCEHPAKRFMNAGEWYDITMDLFRNFLKTEDGCNFINGKANLHFCLLKIIYSIQGLSVELLSQLNDWD